MSDDIYYSPKVKIVCKTAKTFRSYPDDSAELGNVGEVIVSEAREGAREFIFNIAPTWCFV